MTAVKPKQEKGISGILNKLHLIMEDVPYIQKDSKNTHFNYSYASELAIKTALHASMIKHKVILQLETMNSRVEATSKTTILSCRYKFWDVDSGENLEGLFEAAGPARDDKGVWAATTNAIKYILTSTFLIPTGDDAESDANHPAPPAGNGKSEPQRGVDPKPKKPLLEDEAKKKFWLLLQEKAKKDDVELPKNIPGFVEYIKEYMGTGKWADMFARLGDAHLQSIKTNFIGSKFDKE